MSEALHRALRGGRVAVQFEGDNYEVRVEKIPHPDKLGEFVPTARLCEDCCKTKFSSHVRNCPVKEELHGIEFPVLICDRCYRERSRDT